MKKLICLMIAVVMVVGLAACGGGGSSSQAPAASSAAPAGSSTAAPADSSAAAPAATEGESYTMKASTYLNEAHPMYYLLQNYVKNVDEASGGRIKITIYPGEQLGGYEQTFQETIQGTLEFGFNAIPGTFDDRIEAVFVPGAVSDFDMLEKFIKPGNTVFNIYEEALGDAGIKMLGWMAGGYYPLCFNIEPPEGALDPTVKKGEIIRVPSTVAMFNEWVMSMGYNTAQLPGVDVYSALQTGTIQGNVGQSPGLILSAYADVTKYAYDLKLVHGIDCIFMNQNLFNGMSAEDQKILEDAANTFLSENMDYLRKEDSTLKEDLAGVDVEWLVPTDDEREKLYAAVIDATKPLVIETFGQEFYDNVMKDVGLA